MKHYPSFFCTAALIAALCSCTKQAAPSNGNFNGNSFDEIAHGEIILGDKLDNPYSVGNVKSAVNSLYGTKAAQKIGATDLYVRFLPKSDEDVELLKSKGLVLVDHPVDYNIVRDGDYYHDPELDNDEITWQYSVVPVGFDFPEGIRHEVLESCYLAENDKTKAMGDGIDWAAVEAESFRLTGNGNMLSPASVKGESFYPSGRITIVDDKANGGQAFGVSGVRVQCNVFVKFSQAFTDRDGYYEMPKKFTANPRYRLVFINEKGFGIGLNVIIFPASTSTLGKGSPAGVSVTIDRNSDRALFRRSVVNNAAYDFFEKCAAENLNLTAPPADIRFWMFDNLDASSTVMLHHGTVLDGDSAAKFFKIVSAVVEFFGPDITIGSEKLLTYSQLYSTVVHELSHACHFSKVGTDYWNNYIYYIVKCGLSGLDTYGTASTTGNGYCEVGEMWAYYMESKLYKSRYGSSDGNSFGTTYWFHPQIFTYLDERGIPASDILAALDSEVTSKEELKNRLIDLYPQKKTNINQVFNRYE